MWPASPSRERSSPSPTPGSATAIRPRKRSSGSTPRETGAKFRRRLAHLPDADPEPRLCRRRRQHRLLQPRPGAAAQVRRRPHTRRRRVGRLRLDRHDPVRSIAAALQPGDRLRLQRQQRRCPADHQPSLGFDYEENFRARRIQQFFDTIGKHSLETSATMQADHLSLDVKELQPFIATIAPANDCARGRPRRCS